jgi:MFS family permease
VKTEASTAGQSRKSSFWADLRVVLAERDFRKLFAIRLASQAGGGVFSAGFTAYVFFSAATFPSPAATVEAFTVLYLPFSLIGPFVGVFIDRWSRRQILLWASVIQAGMVVVASLIVLSGQTKLPFYISVLAILGAGRFLGSAISAGTPHVVAPGKLVMANAVAPTCGTIAGLVGGMLGLGMRLATGGGHLGSAVTLLVSAVFYVVTGLFALRMGRDLLGPNRAAGDEPARVQQDLRTNGGSATRSEERAELGAVAEDWPLRREASARRSELASEHLARSGQARGSRAKREGPRGAGRSYGGQLVGEGGSGGIGVHPPRGTSLAAELGGVATGLWDALRHLRQRRQASYALGAISAHHALYGVLLMQGLLLYRNYFYPGGNGNAALGHATWLVATSAIGFALAAVITPVGTKRLSLDAWITTWLVAGAVTTLALGPTFSQVPFLVMGFVMGLSAQCVKICVDTTVQQHVADEYMGRVFSVYDMLYNTTYVIGPALAAPFLPDTGKSYVVVMVIGADYLVAAVIYAALTLRRQAAAGSPPPRPTAIARR